MLTIEIEIFIENRICYGAQRAEFVYFWIKIPRGVEGREGRKEELTQSGNKTITRGVISWSKKEIFRFFGVIFL